MFSTRLSLRQMGSAFLMAASMVVSAPSAFAQEGATQTVAPADRGPALGAVAPFPKSLEAHTGAQVTLADLMGANGAALMFNRSLDWCPYCRGQANDLIDRAGDFQAAGYGVTVITYDSIAKLETFAASRDLPLPLLSDPGSATIDAFGLRNMKYGPGSFAEGVPHPMIVVVAPDGTVKAKFAEAGYKARPDLDAVLAALKALDTAG